MKRIFTLLFLVSLFACQQADRSPVSGFELPYEKFTLDNGLEVIFHTDYSDPVVSVTLAAHVGSAREKVGRTGFAHLFEHLLFLESENLGKGGLDRMSARIGGAGANGFTNRDITTYFQTVPKDALEKMIWAEADKLGWFINTVTDPVLAKEKSVVKNEKRQVVDNRPYGHTDYVISKHAYPDGHPYSWTVIGSLADLEASTLEDVKEFYNTWYVPNNVSLVIAGDFDKEQAREWVYKYFDEIPRSEDIEPLEKSPVAIPESKLLYHEDHFARLPELTLTWASVDMIHEDYYALEVLASYLSEGKKAPLYKTLVKDKKLAPQVYMYNYSSELAGMLMLQVRAFEGIRLDSVKAAIDLTFARFEEEGISEKDVSRILAGLETSFYSQLSSVDGKGIQLAHSNILTGDPAFAEKELEIMLSITPEDVERVYRNYIRDKHFIATSFVPKGEAALVRGGSQRAGVVEERVDMIAEAAFDPTQEASYEKTPSTFDRSVEPPYGESPDVKIPGVWEEILGNGMKVYGIENREVPLVNFNIVIPGGQLLEEAEKAGVVNLMADLMNKGTKNRTPVELEDAIQQLGSSVNIYSGQQHIEISASCLARNFPQTVDLLAEMILEPRWDQEELELAKLEVISSLQQQAADPGSLARNNFSKLIYGKDDIRSLNTLGTIESVTSLGMDDLVACYNSSFCPLAAKMHVVGAVDREEVIASMGALSENWTTAGCKKPEVTDPAPVEKSALYFYDVPGAKQSVIHIGYPALAAVDEDYFPATVMNYILGGGGFASRLTQELRERKGYTYGVRSRFSGTNYRGPFSITTSVQSKVTLEAMELIKSIVDEYGATFTPSDLETTRSFLLKSNARAFETARAKLGMLEDISAYNWDYDYVKQREEIVKAMSMARIQELSVQYLDTDRMVWLVVGDAATQKDRLGRLGFGNAILLN